MNTESVTNKEDTELAQSSDDYRVRWLTSRVGMKLQGKRILDVGCGNGFICEQLLMSGAQEVVGCDIVPVNAASSWKFVELDLAQSDWARALSQEGNRTAPFDCISAFDIIEHVQNPMLFLQECKKLMDESSILALTTPNTNSWERMLHPDSWSGATDPQHTILFNEYSLEFLLKKAGFVVKSKEAPIQKLSFLNHIIPNWGGQLMMTAQKSH